VEEGWERREPALMLDQAAIIELLRPAFPHTDVETAELLGGGLVNTNYRVTLAGRAEPVVLRVYTRDHDACAKEANILNLVRTSVPVPEVLHVESESIRGGNPYLVLSWIDGVKPHQVLRAAAPADVDGIGYACGITLWAIARYTFPAAGFLGPDLRVVQPFNSIRAAVQGYIQERLAEGRVRERLGPDLAERLGRLVADNAARLDELEGSTSLVHSDYKAVNLLLGNTDHGWAMAGVLDWEFAHAGTPLIDLGILLRESARMPTEFERGVVRGFRDAGGALPRDWKRISKLVDLVNLCGFLGAVEERGAMVGDVAAVVRATVEHWDAFAPDKSI
jgi:aminoglycoside phosphotransferase (APT) family kinase protein